MGKEEIKEKVKYLGQIINAPSAYLILRDKPLGDGSYYAEFKDDQYYLISSERGKKLDRKVTSDIDQFLYWVFKDVVFKMAVDYELNHRQPYKDPRRLIFSKRIELLSKLNSSWGEREKIEIEKYLKQAPYDDDIDVRVKLTKTFMAKGISSLDAYKQACEKYPLPKSI